MGDNSGMLETWNALYDLLELNRLESFLYRKSGALELLPCRLVNLCFFQVA